MDGRGSSAWRIVAASRAIAPYLGGVVPGADGSVTVPGLPAGVRAAGPHWVVVESPVPAVPGRRIRPRHSAANDDRG